MYRQQIYFNMVFAALLAGVTTLYWCFELVKYVRCIYKQLNDMKRLCIGKSALNMKNIK